MNRTSPMLGSNRGVARVSIVWMVAVGVLFLAALAFAFIVSSDLAAARQTAVTAEQRARQAQEASDQAAQYARTLTTSVGWYDRESADPRANVESVREQLQALRRQFSDLGEADDTIEEAVAKILPVYDQRTRRIAELEGRIQTLENELQASQNTLSEVQREKDQQIAQLRQQMADEVQAAQSRNDDLERRLAAGQNQLSERDLEVRRIQNEMQAADRSFGKKEQTLMARISALSETTKFAKDPFSDYPDGKILTVSEGLPLAWIDLGADDRLVRGLRFRVESDTPGLERVKGWVRVRDVKRDMAEVEIVEQADRFDPIAAGDVIINPIYDPKGGRNAILVGRFSGAYDEEELRGLLDRIGVRVQDDLTLTTHFMIVGAPVYHDPETGEVLEEPIDPSDLPIYRNAVANGVQVIPLQDLRSFIESEPRGSRTTARQ